MPWVRRLEMLANDSEWRAKNHARLNPTDERRDHRVPYWVVRRSPYEEKNTTHG